MEIDQRLGLDDRYLIGIGVEGVDVHLVSAGLEIDVAERLQPSDGQVGEADEHAAVAGEAFEVDVALAIEIGAHFFDLEIGHVAHAPAERAFVVSLPAKLESLDESAFGQLLRRRVDQLGQAEVSCIDTDDV